jgi:hypothetical protein
VDERPRGPTSVHVESEKGSKLVKRIKPRSRASDQAKCGAGHSHQHETWHHDFSLTGDFKDEGDVNRIMDRLVDWAMRHKQVVDALICELHPLFGEDPLCTFAIRVYPEGHPDPEMAVAHSTRFRKVSNRYSRTVAYAYEGDLARAMRDSDEQVAATVAEFERQNGYPVQDWIAIGREERDEMIETGADRC